MDTGDIDELLWSLDLHLFLTGEEPPQQFGTGVGTRGGTVVVTALFTSFPTMPRNGSVQVFTPGVVFSDRFESGDTSAWSNAVP